MPMAMVGLGVILVVSAATGKYAIAGAVSATGSLCYAFVAPQVGRLMDRFGQGRVLRPLIVAFAAGAVAFILCAQLGAPLWTLFVTGAMFMSTLPSLGSVVRSRWSALLGDSPLLHTAFSFESVADELIFVAGPALVTILATQVVPVAGIAVAAVLAVTGTLLLAVQRGTEPPAVPRQHRAAGRSPPRACPCSWWSSSAWARCSARWTSARSRSPPSITRRRWPG